VSYRPTHARQVSVPNSEVRWAPNLLPNILKPVWQERQAAVASTNNVSMKSIGQPELQLNMPLAPNARMDYGPAISPRLVAGPSQFDRGTMADSQANLPASAQPHDDGTRPSEVPSASTLHLDGSALGRWAIQHLERTLAKPTAGMTGIDPRASAPRSRVAPF
jgi:hypothetical protein